MLARRNVFGALLLALVTLILASCTGASPPSSSDQPAGSTPVRDLTGISGLRQLFNQDAGDVRLVLLVSPT